MGTTTSTSPLQFVESLGVGSIEHDSGGPFLEHLTGVQEVLEEWGERREICLAGLYHSIYGSELFQDFQLSLDKRDTVKELIGEYAEALVYAFCTMDLASLDATINHPPGQHFLMQRKQHGGGKLPLTDQQYQDMCIVQMADWLQQVERWAQKPEEKLGWGVGEAWGHRRSGYRRMAERLGGKYLKAYDEVYAREPSHTKHICHDVTPEVKHQVPAVKV